MPHNPGQTSARSAQRMEVSFDDVLEARERIRPYLRPSPIYEYPVLSALLDTRIWVNQENHQSVGNFKVRGGINLLSRFEPRERPADVITASTGNHGQSIAYAARLFGIAATICLPGKANPVKVESMRALVKTKNLVEPAGGAALAAAIRLRDVLAGSSVALTCTSGNISPAQLADLLGRFRDQAPWN